MNKPTNQPTNQRVRNLKHFHGTILTSQILARPPTTSTSTIFKSQPPNPSTATMGDASLFSDTFTIFDINAQKYDRVARLSAHTEGGETTLTLDVNSELFPCNNGDRLQILLTSTLSLDGSKDDGKGWRDVGRGEASVADDYDYVCHGKVYRFEEGDEEKM